MPSCRIWEGDLQLKTVTLHVDRDESSIAIEETSATIRITISSQRSLRCRLFFVNNTLALRIHGNSVITKHSPFRSSRNKLK